MFGFKDIIPLSDNDFKTILQEKCANHFELASFLHHTYHFANDSIGKFDLSPFLIDEKTVYPAFEDFAKIFSHSKLHPTIANIVKNGYAFRKNSKEKWERFIVNKEVLKELYPKINATFNTSWNPALLSIALVIAKDLLF